MKKRVFALILTVLMLAALTACGGDADRIAQLEAENEALKAQVEDLNSQLKNAAAFAGLSDWSFEAFAWSSNNGANITFTGTPVSYTEGQTARFSAWLEGEQVATADCTWDGAVYTGKLDLNADDGYCYYCTIVNADGTENEVELNTPKTPTDDKIIDLETSLASYCAMMVEDSKLEGNTLTIVAGYAQVQMPRIGQTAEGVTVTGAQMVLDAVGNEIARCDLTMEATGTPDHYAAQIAGLSFTIPALEDDQQLNIRMDVQLSDGQTLTTAGGSWFYNGGELYLVVG